jgi:hypothetical protein
MPRLFVQFCLYSPVFFFIDCFSVIYYLRGTASKWVTNGSKSAVVDVTDFLCVSLGSRRVQLRSSLGSRTSCACSEAGFSSLNGGRAWGLYYRRASFCCAVLYGEKDSMQRIFIKKCFMFTGRSFCGVKRFTTRSRNSLKHFRKSQMMPDHVCLLRLRHKQLCIGWNSWFQLTGG